MQSSLADQEQQVKPLLPSFKWHSPELDQFRQINRDLSPLSIEIISPETFAFRDHVSGETIYVEAQEIDQLIKALQALKAAGEYEQLREKELARLSQWLTR